jgi:F-type H+-transporting ATPase subunit b
MGIGLDLSVFIGQLVSFLILLAVLTYFGYKPLRRVLEERSERIRASVEQAEMTRIEYENARLQAQEELQRAQREARQALVEAGAARDRLLEEAQVEARKEAHAIIEDARQRIRNERESMLEELRRRFADAAVSVAESILREDLDAGRHRQLIEHALDERLPLEEDDSRP